MFRIFGVLHRQVEARRIYRFSDLSSYLWSILIDFSFAPRHRCGLRRRVIPSGRWDCGWAAFYLWVWNRQRWEVWGDSIPAFILQFLYKFNISVIVSAFYVHWTIMSPVPISRYALLGTLFNIQIPSCFTSPISSLKLEKSIKLPSSFLLPGIYLIKQVPLATNELISWKTGIE